MKIIYICVLLGQKHAHKKKGKQAFLILELVKNVVSDTRHSKAEFYNPNCAKVCMQSLI